MISDYPAYELSLNKTITTLPDPGLHLVLYSAYHTDDIAVKGMLSYYVW